MHIICTSLSLSIYIYIRIYIYTYICIYIQIDVYVYTHGIRSIRRLRIWIPQGSARRAAGQTAAPAAEKGLLRHIWIYIYIIYIYIYKNTYLYLCVYIYIYYHIIFYYIILYYIISYDIITFYYILCILTTTAAPAAEKAAEREFRDVVFEDVGLELNSRLTLKHWRCGDFTLQLIWVRGLKLVFWNPTSWNTTSLNTQANRPSLRIPCDPRKLLMACCVPDSAATSVRIV